MMNRRTASIGIIFHVIILLLSFSCGRITMPDQLKKGFTNPPDSARPGVYWYFMDGNIDRESITKDLESMKKAGLSYALFLEVNVGIPRGKVDFLSDEWLDLFRHAVREAERLGIRIILGSGPGWAGSGGPWIRPEGSMKHLVASDTTLTGPLVFEGRLGIPEPREPFFGQESVPANLKTERESWYKDFRILAFPAPANPAKLTGTDDKAYYYRAPYTSQAGVVPFFIARPEYGEINGEYIIKGQIIDLTNRLQEDGTFQWSVPPGKWTILRFGMRNNGSVTRPAPLPGLGFESDKFDTAAVSFHYKEYIGKLADFVKPRKQSNGGGWTMIHIDSWEMGAQNWTGNFVDEFIKRRGYDPLLYLPVFKGYIINSPEISERFLWDVRQTASDLIIENHASRLKELGRKSGFIISIEPYDMNPASDIDLGLVADVPMGEFWSDGFGFNSAFSCIEASSIGHLTGKPVVAAEAFTSSSEEAWKLYPGAMKNQTDWALAMGINRFIFHTFAHKPLNDELVPGMTMGPYGVHWDRKQTWWPMVKGYHDYLARCQLLLSQGTPVADILYLTSEGAPNVFKPPSSAMEGSETMPDKKGHSFDGCSPSFLIENATVRDGSIVFPGGASYKILVLPGIETMTPELIKKIEELLKLGATVAGPPPLKSPSLEGFPESDASVKRFSDAIWQGMTDIGYTFSTYSRGHTYLTSKIQDNMESMPPDTAYSLFPSYSRINYLLQYNNVLPDFISEGNFRYAHRSMQDREIYFVSNRTGETVSDSCVFRDGTMNAEIWDPMTGKIRNLFYQKRIAGGIKIRLKLEAWQSCFVVFYKTERNPSEIPSEDSDFPSFNPLMQLKGPWSVSFNAKTGGYGTVSFDTLSSWTAREEEGIRYYSGVATYTIDFDLPDGIDGKRKEELVLSLGNVKNIAKVKLNEKDLGIVWTDPWTIDMGKSIRQKANHLEIEVANLWVNRLIGDEAKPWDGIENGKWPEWLVNNTARSSGRNTFTTTRYYKKEDPLLESGLLGPVRILIKE